ACLSTLLHSSSVDPVVSMSSTSSTDFPLTFSGDMTEKAPLTFWFLFCLSNRLWASVYLSLLRNFEHSGSLMILLSAFDIRYAWLYPLMNSLCLCSGTL